MLHLFAGDDTKAKISSYEKFLATFPKGTEKFFISRNNFDKTQIESLYSSNGLFFANSVVVFEGVLEYEDQRDFSLGKLTEMSASSSTFIFSENKLAKPILDAFKKARAELNIFELPKERKEKFNSFLLANALGDRDKLNIWVYFRQAVALDVSLEELIGALFWKVKDMILKRNFCKFKEQELKSIAAKISYLLPEARKEGGDAEAAFEQFLLEVV